MSVLVSSATSCNKEDDIIIEKNNPMANGKIKITVNSQTFTATLLDNNSAKAFKEMLPLIINMTDLNGNEKYYDFPNNLPTNSSNPGAIKNGDLILVKVAHKFSQPMMQKNINQQHSQKHYGKTQR